MHQHSAACQHTIATQTIATQSIATQTIDPQAKQAQLAIALLLLGGFAIAELVVGLTSGSLALIAEAGHMAADSLALLLALLATRFAQPKRSVLSDSLTDIMATPFKVQPVAAWETWAALTNGLALVTIALWIGWEAIQRLHTPPEAIASLPMLLTAGVGLAVNSVIIALLHRGSAHDLNLRGAFLHVLADAVSCIGVILAAIAVTALHWLWADGAISLFVAGVILFSAVPLVMQSLKGLREGREKAEGRR